jgi:hypothetical protein
MPDEPNHRLARLEAYNATSVRPTAWAANGRTGSIRGAQVRERGGRRRSVRVSA